MLRIAFIMMEGVIIWVEPDCEINEFYGAFVLLLLGCDGAQAMDRIRMAGVFLKDCLIENDCVRKQALLLQPQRPSEPFMDAHEGFFGFFGFFRVHQLIVLGAGQRSRLAANPYATSFLT